MKTSQLYTSILINEYIDSFMKIKQNFSESRMELVMFVDKNHIYTLKTKGIFALV